MSAYSLYFLSYMKLPQSRFIKFELARKIVSACFIHYKILIFDYNYQSEFSMQTLIVSLGFL